ncbi:putative N6-adenine-specific DNA methylase [Symbiobacterium terraclitae]|uniref:N6-adenine-specific DNA methylase n=1 Tax=Symbiobacterium terraclitae TaxID=557451 RepID=A0ABS4JRZ1_9FIRM|nr:putative N6-adenine-specific DNA methylase [Symbiobacterium terraclitae]
MTGVGRQTAAAGAKPRPGQAGATPEGAPPEPGGRLRLIATAPMGLEAVVARELKGLGYGQQQVENGRVRFAGEELAVCRANLWLRTADRVLVEMAEFPATTFEELFQGVRAIPWEDWIPEDGRFIVNGRSHQSQLSSVPACQKVAEKAVVERLRQRYPVEWFPKSGARYSIEVSLLKDVVTVTLDTTGPGLHKRGYRKLAAEAPIKETLAAAMVLLSRWHPDRPLLDPCCGSGTIPVEAALIGHNLAPGLHRTFDAEAWGRIPARLWEEAREEAFDLADYDRPLDIRGSDIDAEVLELAQHHLRAAGLSRSVRLERRPLQQVEKYASYGYLITNPPYGERMGEREAVEELYRDLGRLARRLEDWSVFVITAHKGFERFFGRRADRKRKLYNGRIECDLYQFEGPYHGRRVPGTGEESSAEG